MTTTLTSDEREERPQPELLFVELRSQHAFTVKPEPYIETVEYLRKATVNAHYEDLMRAALLREESAATQMRDKCVGRLKARRDKFQQAADSSSLPNDLTASRDAAVAAALTGLLGELESLTLDTDKAQ